MPRLARITIYPVKSLDGLAVTEARVLDAGSLAGDRQWAIVDAASLPLNGKREPKVHALRLHADPSARTFRLAAAGDDRTFHVDAEADALRQWLSQYFGQPVRLMEHDLGGFPDDEESPGPTIVSSATLETVASWFPELSVEEIRRRFRANLEIDDVEPFWEDRLFGSSGAEVEFSVGGVRFAGTNPCQRCAVPTRDSQTGAVYPAFARRFSQRRAESLPPWAARERFDHYYRLSTNTRLAQPRGGVVRLGDPVA